PLRARREDVPLLAEHFLHKHASSLGRPIAAFDTDALRALCDYDYPGNVRELENLVERAVTLESGNRVSRGSLPELHRRHPSPPAATLDVPDDGLDLDKILAEVERDLVLKALEKAGGVRKRAAELLGVTFRSLRYRLAKMGVEQREDDGEGDPPTSSG